MTNNFEKWRSLDADAVQIFHKEERGHISSWKTLCILFQYKAQCIYYLFGVFDLPL